MSGTGPVVWGWGSFKHDSTNHIWFTKPDPALLTFHDSAAFASKSNLPSRWQVGHSIQHKNVSNSLTRSRTEASFKNCDYQRATLSAWLWGGAHSVTAGCEQVNQEIHDPQSYAEHADGTRGIITVCSMLTSKGLIHCKPKLITEHWDDLRTVKQKKPKKQQQLLLLWCHDLLPVMNLWQLKVFSSFFFSWCAATCVPSMD